MVFAGFRGIIICFTSLIRMGRNGRICTGGHTASRDLVHWIHLPIALSPQEEILERPDEIKGGAFSGCAVVAGDEAVFYLTRHKGPLQDGRDTVEQQWMMKSRDMIHFTGEKCVIANPPKGASFDFRDPKVIRVGGEMVYGSRKRYGWQECDTFV